ncbi:MAG: efflux RND transporter permease subunit [Candidatus Omnitrophica bacterium]|nr:efflux RND transporter permease subunit [Candidatus Omnitrophota bacterium]
MNIAGLSARRPIGVSMLFIGIIIIGVIAFALLPVEMMPNISFGDITINIDVRGGIPASEVEKRIAKPVEEAVGSAGNLKNILAISKEGNATIILEFQPGTNMEFAALDVREKFNRVKNKLPPEIEKPIIAKYEYMDVPIMIIAVTSKFRTPEEIRKIVDEKIKDRIQRIEGVARAEITGGREGKIIIEVDQRKLQSYGLSINRLVSIINVNNINLLAGEVKRSRDKYLVRTMGEFESLQEIGELAIATTKEGSVIRVKDVSKVKDSYLDPVDYARLNAQPVVSIYIQKESTANTVNIAKLIRKELKKLEESLDTDIEITPTFNQAEVIEAAVNQVKAALWQGALLSSAVLFLFLRDIRLVNIIAVSIPLAVLATFSCMYASKLTINVMTLSGLALGVGMLVDNSIVVLDNIFKKRDEFLTDKTKLADALINPRLMNTTVKQLAIEGSEEMFLAIIASTLTNIIVFIPLLFINPETKLLYGGIALTITFSLLASLLTAIAIVPMAMSRFKFTFPKKQKEEILIAKIAQTASTAPEPEKTTSPREDAALSASESIHRAAPEPPKRFIISFASFYKGLVSIVLSLRYLVIILALLLFARIVKEAKTLEKEFIGIAEQNKFTIFIELPTGTKLDVSDRIVKKVEEITKRVPEIKNATAKVEPWSSKLYVELKPLNKRKRTTAEIINGMRPLTEKIEPAFIYYEEPEEVGTKEIIVELYGLDYDKLKSLAVQSAQRLQTIPKFTDVKIRMREGRPEWQLYIDKREAALFGLTVEDISLALHTHMRGLVATRFRGDPKEAPFVRLREPLPYRLSLFAPETPGEVPASAINISKEDPGSKSDSEAKEVETIVRLEEQYRQSIDDLRRISLVTPDGLQIYLFQITKFNYDIGPSEIWRKNKSRMVQVSANTGGVALGTAAENVKKVLKDLPLPKDYFWQIGGNYDKMILNEQELQSALTLSVIFVYMVLACLFESFIQPFIILVTVPLGAIGAITALIWTHKAVGLGVLMGAIMLGGIVVNNAIVLIDRINFLRAKPGTGHDTRKGTRSAVIIAAYDRLRPIMMTSLTTILGLIPLALDKSESSNLWSPLAITMIGGMTVSTFLTLFIIPCVYMITRDFTWIKK